ncbi:methyltransferase domain-containing protein [Streptococcus gallolyticus]|nr:methyltransferase domain-containing protein [Streptococcus gallolyticus]MBY5041484.1 methyltransferase domain-containing protein [Streptococcus gallolyticus]
MVDKRQRFDNSADFFACPICRQALEKDGNSLKCASNHTYDLSKFGYVNLLGGKKVNDHYSKESFENRKLILENGFYEHILTAIEEILSDYPQVKTLLDIGCGEGYYSRQLLQKTDKEILSFDISKDSVQIAAKSDQTYRGKWFVSDLANLPIQLGKMDVILDIFSPANYGEFKRVLAEDGLLIKVIPTAEHVQELRAKVRDHLQEKEYSNQKIVAHFQESFEIVTQKEIVKTTACSAEERQAFIDMTPLLFNVDTSQIDWSDVDRISVGAMILVGKVK